MSAIGFAGIIFSSHLWGFLADTQGRRKIIRPTLLVAFCITFLSSFSNDFWTLVILRFLNGFCVSGGSATVYAYLGEFHTQKNRARAIMGAAFIFGLGAMLMPAIAWLFINQEWRFAIPFLGITYKPWRLFMVICGIPGLICGLSLFKIPESPKYYLGQGKEDKALEILKDIYHMNTGKPRDSYPVTRVTEDLDPNSKPRVVVNNDNRNAASILLRSMWTQTQPLFNREYIRNTLLICFIQFSIFVTSNGMYMWFPYILNSVAEFMSENPGNTTYICDVVYAKQKVMMQLELAQNDASIDFTQECNEKLEISTYKHSLVLEVLYAVGFAFIGAIINRIGKRIILFVCLAICGICGVGTIYVDIPMLAIYLYVVLLLCGLVINVLSAATVDLYPTRLRAMAVCISLMVGRLGSVVGANVVGALITNHCEAAFLTSGISLIVAGLLGFLIAKNPKIVAVDTSRRASLVSMTGN
ncbi:hypothetical protein FF38_13813 [Lucilia cuprina]|uniref:Major facilitator superfamily (MFS) profile domain-containing protein n=1 Tax=Lucilia cuprina TaxID=7375 RepID=A0A0L0BUM3_LUCCU|nr:hypothetical protein FF38_13813 [Lucilia cuprina]